MDGSTWTCRVTAMDGLQATSATVELQRQVALRRGWTAMSTGTSRTCAVKADSTLWTWGRNQYGQLGDETAWRETPFRVSLP